MKQSLESNPGDWEERAETYWVQDTKNDIIYKQEAKIIQQLNPLLEGYSLRSLVDSTFKRIFSKLELWNNNFKSAVDDAIGLPGSEDDDGFDDYSY